MLKEVVLGIGLGMIIFLAVSGYDVTPVLFLGVAAGALFYIARSRGLATKAFNTAPLARRPEISFDDIGGQNTAIKELKEALDFIKNQEQIIKLGIRPIKGILLTGPPGTGKTLLAKAAAGYTDSVFIACSGSEFIEMYAGVGAQRVRQLFQTARDTGQKQKKDSALIFIDEIDILGGKRGQNTSHHEYDQTLNQLLVEMDGLKVNDKVRVLVVAATNRADMLDPALLRPGRFDRQVKVDLPDKQGRLEILKLHCRNKPLAKDINLEEIAKETFSFSGAHLESLANEGAILAMREGCLEIKHRHLHEAIDKVMMGEKLDRRPSRPELERVAVHEVGHALISEKNRPGSVSTLTITPRGQALGYMRQIPEDDTYLHTRDYLENQIRVLLAGSVAEEMVLGNRSTGATNDFEQAVKVAAQIIRSGMSELGVVDPEILPPDLRYRVVSGIIKEQEKKVKEFLGRMHGAIKQIVHILLAEEKISGEQFRIMMKSYGN
ncbi:AAA family ATPase [Desulfoscipio gibsoniae]|uniref:ATP-dependent Zn protease n=1 Tax=Desulfoscipio gibsoniae DSM 7213 TaxID=767817 RepID=R4KI64_9FIRM|nr:AAA family ATPase [Desulfoscipio gibsoniae]AGL01327.1 ATP-dependent Zn protease [Desulfoscipio gibsoniae DSM 7213]